MPSMETLAAILGTVLLLFHILGVLHAVHALMYVRTSQGTIAWESPQNQRSPP